MSIKIKFRTTLPTINECLPKIIEKGEWIDLYVAEDVTLGRLCTKATLVRLGVAMQLPKGFEAIIAPRSSAVLKQFVIAGNSIGIIDNTYCGNNDEWKWPVFPIRDTTISKGMRICQFRIQLSQKATFWQKLKWLFSNKIELVQVNSFDCTTDRGGFGTTGK